MRQGSSDLVEGLTLGKAIKCARQLARDQHERTGCEVTVELVIPEKSLQLALYASLAVGQLSQVALAVTGEVEDEVDHSRRVNTAPRSSTPEVAKASSSSGDGVGASNNRAGGFVFILA